MVRTRPTASAPIRASPRALAELYRLRRCSQSAGGDREEEHGPRHRHGKSGHAAPDERRDGAREPRRLPPRVARLTRAPNRRPGQHDVQGEQRRQTQRAGFGQPLEQIVVHPSRGERRREHAVGGGAGLGVAGEQDREISRAHADQRRLARHRPGAPPQAEARARDRRAGRDPLVDHLRSRREPLGVAGVVRRPAPRNPRNQPDPHDGRCEPDQRQPRPAWPANRQEDSAAGGAADPRSPGSGHGQEHHLRKHEFEGPWVADRPLLGAAEGGQPQRQRHRDRLGGDVPVSERGSRHADAGDGQRTDAEVLGQPHNRNQRRPHLDHIRQTPALARPQRRCSQRHARRRRPPHQLAHRVGRTRRVARRQDGGQRRGQQHRQAGCRDATIDARAGKVRARPHPDGGAQRARDDQHRQLHRDERGGQPGRVGQHDRQRGGRQQQAAGRGRRVGHAEAGTVFAPGAAAGQRSRRSSSRPANRSSTRRR